MSFYDIKGYDEREHLLGLFMIRNAVEEGIKSSHDFTFSHYMIMLHLMRNPALRIADIASSLELKPNTASLAVMGLEEQGFIEKRVDNVDARAVNLSLTKDGIESFKRTSRVLMNRLRDYWEPLTHEQKKMVSNLDNVETAEQPDPDYIETVYFLSKTIDKTMVAEELTFTQLLILMELNMASGAIRPFELTKKLDIPSNTLAAALKVLETKNYVIRTNKGAFGTQLMITEQGRALAMKTASKLINAIWENLSNRFDRDRMANLLEINFSMLKPFN